MATRRRFRNRAHDTHGVPPNRGGTPWHALDVAEVGTRLGTGPAGLVTVVLGKHIDAGVIFVVLLLNTAIGATQEQRAERSVRALMQLVSPRARMIREGRELDLPSERLVPGDLVLLESGVRVPADIRLVTVNALAVDESLLTGESLPVAKRIAPVEADTPLADRTNTAHAGSVVTAGRGRGFVVATGNATALGTIAAGLRETRRRPTPLQARMHRFAHIIGVAVAVSAATAFAIGWLRGEAPTDMFLVAVGLTVASVPEGLPVVFTIAMALGVRRMARRQAIIRRLPAVETLGSTTVIGSDKTGTLTENRMTVEEVWAGGETFVVGAAAATLPAGAGDGADATDPLRLTLVTGVLRRSTCRRRSSSFGSRRSTSTRGSGSSRSPPPFSWRWSS